MAEHFVKAPDWMWYILFYFFLAGISGGSYAIATLLRLRGTPADQPAVRLGYYVAWPALLICPILLTLDLGRPLRFWHMVWNVTPGEPGLNFKYWSPMSVGVWALIIFTAFATVSFAEALVRDRVVRHRLGDRLTALLDGRLGQVFNIVGGVFGLFIAGYTGVLLAVTNQPVWSDTWALGALFLASGLAGSAVLLLFLIRYRRDAEPSSQILTISERLYALLELALIGVFALTLLWAGTQGMVFGWPWTLLWIVAIAGLIPGIWGLITSRLSYREGTVVASLPTAMAVPLLGLVGVLALRAAVIFSVQV